MLIKEFTDGTRVFGPYFVNESKKGTTAAGKTYLNVTLQDCSGTIEAKKWDVAPGDEELFARGKVVQIEGQVILYSGHLQMKVFSAEPLNQKDVDWALFIPAAPVEQKTLENKLGLYLSSIEDEAIKRLVEALIAKFRDRFLVWPAAVRNHHNFVSGLLYHSLTMADLAMKACEVYPVLSRDVMLGGVLVHDLGKIIELSSPQATTFTLQGKLLGHISIGQAELRQTAKELGYYAFDDLSEEEKEKESKANGPVFHRYEIAVLFEHIILSHHGRQDFGSPVLPLTREALAISLIDDFDAKMLILDNASNGIAPGESTAKIFSLDERYFYIPRFAETNGKPYGTSLEDQEKDLDATSKMTVPIQGKLF